MTWVVWILFPWPFHFAVLIFMIEDMQRQKNSAKNEKWLFISFLCNLRTETRSMANCHQFAEPVMYVHMQRNAQSTHQSQHSFFLLVTVNLLYKSDSNFCHYFPHLEFYADFHTNVIFSSSILSPIPTLFIPPTPLTLSVHRYFICTDHIYMIYIPVPPTLCLAICTRRQS